VGPVERDETVVEREGRRPERGGAAVEDATPRTQTAVPAGRPVEGQQTIGDVGRAAEGVGDAAPYPRAQEDELPGTSVAGAAGRRVAGEDGVNPGYHGRLKPPARQRDGPRVVDAPAGGRADEPDRGGAGVAVAADRPALEDGAVADDGRRTAGGED